MDKIQIYITKEELEEIIHKFDYFDDNYGLSSISRELYKRLLNLNNNWGEELYKQTPSKSQIRRINIQTGKPMDEETLNMETITIELIGGTIITLLVVSYGYYKGIFYFKDKDNNSHIYDSSEIISIKRG